MSIHYLETANRVLKVEFIHDHPRPGMSVMDVSVERGPNFTDEEWAEIAGRTLRKYCKNGKQASVSVIRREP